MLAGCAAMAPPGEATRRHQDRHGRACAGSVVDVSTEGDSSVRVSSYYGLGLVQPSLEFVDVDIRTDTPVFVDPRALHPLDSDWGNECVSLLQSFFTTVLDAIQSGRDSRAQGLLASLAEPNETRLGLSAGRAQGRGMGRDLARDTWEALRVSRAVSTGLLEDLEDTILFIEGIGFDIISDITTNIIRGPLIQFTNDVCAYYRIKVVAGVASGRIWDHRVRQWTTRYVSLPLTKHGPLLLVPKGIVRRSQTFDPGEYYNHYVLPYLQSEELRAGSSLVEVLKGGGRRVTKKAVKEKYGTGKRVNLDTTLKDASILDRYRQAKARPQMPPSHSEIAALTDTPEPDWETLLQAVMDVQSGTDSASHYHRAIEALLSALLYPALDFPKREHKIHEGRKRIDINYTNVATRGFFHWVHATHGTPASFVPVECKNYGAEIDNPAIDQLAMRFSPGRGQLGFLCHRGYGDKARIVRRCRDAAADGHGYILTLDDDDLRKLVAARAANKDSVSFPLLVERFQELL